jgi:CRP-like cAMP-binding protein
VAENAPKINLTQLMDLVPIKALTQDHCTELAEKSELCQLDSGQYLFKEGETTKLIIYVLEGTVEVFSEEGNSKKVVGGYKTSKLPLEQGEVHRFSAMSKSEITYLKVDPNLLDIMLTWEQSGGYIVEEIEGNTDGEDDGDWMSRILQAKVFHHIPPANIQSIFMRMEARRFETGDNVITQGEEGEHFYIVREGTCKVVRRTRKNPEGVVLAELGVGDNFGEEALISGGKRNASIIMLTPGMLMSLSKKDFLELMNEPMLNWVALSNAKEMVAEGGIWIDVRLPAEHQSRRIDNSHNLPLPILRSKLDKLDKRKKYIIYCDTGRRSSTATYIMTQDGFDAYVLQQGIQSVSPDDLIS